MKEKLMNVCGKLLFAAFVVFFFWGAVEMFRQGAWISCIICVMGVLLFGGPLVFSRISSPAVSESVPLVSQIDLPTDKDSLRELAKLVAGEEADVMQTVEQLLESPEAFYSAQTMRDGEYKGEYCEIWEFYHDKPDLLYSEGLRFVLEEAKVIAMFDWKEGLEEFVGQMTDLRRVQAHNLPVPQEHFDEQADIPHWCNALNELWQPLGYNVMFIDTKGDEYLVAVVQYTPSPPIDDISYTTQS
jgi:hypothetical protein